MANIVSPHSNPDNFDDFNFSQKSHSFDYQCSDIASRRMLRMLLGKIMYVQFAVGEVLEDKSLSEKEKDIRCNTIGAFMKGWLKIAMTSLRPKRDRGLHVEDSDSIDELDQIAQSHPMYELLDDIIHKMFHSEFSGYKWYKTGYEESGMFGSWKQSMEEICNNITKILDTQHSGAFVAEYQLNTLTQLFRESPVFRESLADIFSKWCIDLTKKEDQLGLEWMVSSDELHGYLKKDSAILYVVFDEGLPRAIQIDFTDIGLTEDADQKLPSKGGSAASLALCNDRQIDPALCKYTFIVGIDRDSQQEMKARGLDPYQMLLDASDESGRWMSIQFSFGGVRVKNENFPGNLAMDRHKKRGWVETGNFFETIRGSKLELVYREIGKKQSNEQSPYAVPIWEGRSQLGRVLGNPAKLGAENRQNKDAVCSMDDALKRAQAFLKEQKMHDHCIPYKARGSFDKQDIILIRKGNVDRYFFQEAEGEDLWGCSMGNTEALPFEEQLWRYQEELREYQEFLKTLRH